MTTDISTFKSLCIKNNIDYLSTEIYDDTNKICGWALWFGVGHVEFNLDGNLTNIVNY